MRGSIYELGARNKPFHLASCTTAEQIAKMHNRSDGFLSLLRSETHSQHRQLEEKLNLNRISESLEQYQLVLETFMRIWLPFEAAIAGSPIANDPELKLSKRMRGERLSEDLRSINCNRPVPASVELPWKQLNSEEAAGLLYVMEGSTLGGRLICASLETNLGISRDEGASFFAGHGEQTRERWTEFLQWLENRFSDSRKWPNGAESARKGFSLILKQFSPTSHE